LFILGIESSCDETSLAIVEDERVIANLTASQIHIHEKFGGVVPEIASREHLAILPHLWKELSEKYSNEISKLDGVAVTQGPGLVGALLVGASFAKGISLARNLPLIPVNHVHAHIYSAFLNQNFLANEKNLFPALTLVVSGGHTNLYLMQSALDFKVLGYTLDDACGECFDKVAKMLGLPYPGGPQIEKLARAGNKDKFTFPKMMAGSSDLNFSYSGLKTAVVQMLKKTNTQDQNAVADLCASFQEEALSQLVRKLKSAYEKHSDIQSVIICGGVSANLRFREMFAASIDVPMICPELKYCSDNAAMIAALGGKMLKHKMEKEINWDVFSRYPYESFL